MIADFVKEYLPDDNMSPTLYYGKEKLIFDLGLAYQMIDMFIDNCMVYWKEYTNYLACRFCRKPQFQVTRGRVRVSYKRKWYFPSTDKLKMLYQLSARQSLWCVDFVANLNFRWPVEELEFRISGCGICHQ